MLTNDPYEYVLLFLEVIVHYVMLYMYAEKPNKYQISMTTKCYRHEGRAKRICAQIV